MGWDGGGDQGAVEYVWEPRSCNLESSSIQSSCICTEQWEKNPENSNNLVKEVAISSSRTLDPTVMRRWGEGVTVLWEGSHAMLWEYMCAHRSLEHEFMREGGSMS